MTYKIAERFRSTQGEGVYTGTPMAFIRFVGCSVGKQICQACDTDFDKPLVWRGGGEYTAGELIDWAYPYQHICLTGGEPLDQEHLLELIEQEWGDPDGTGYQYERHTFHIETSGTKMHDILQGRDPDRIWLCVSPKPGFREDVVMAADEVKVIVPGLGTDASAEKLKQDAMKFGRSWHTLAYDSGEFRWPQLDDALRWAAAGKIVFVQPRNAKYDVDKVNLLYCQDLVREYPQLRLSVQLHKVLHVQ